MIQKVTISGWLICSFLVLKSQQRIPPVPVISYDDFAKIEATNYGDYTKLMQAGYTPTCLSNGLIGITPGPNPLTGAMNHLQKASTVVSGFVHNNEIREYEELAAAPYPFGLELEAGGISLRANPGKLHAVRQTLNMNNGVLASVLNFTPGPNTAINIQVDQFASRFVPSVVCEKLTLTASSDVTLTLSTKIDTANSDAQEYGIQRRELTETTPEGVSNIVDQVKVFRSNNGSKLGIALLLQRAHGLIFKQVGSYVIRLKANQPFEVKLIASMISDLYHPDPHLECIRLVRWAELVGYDNLLSENEKIWRELWKSRIKVAGASEFEQRALDAAFYYLQSNIHASSKMGYPPFGLTQSWAYYGHNFWDMDLWTMIPALLVQPNAARSMVLYRNKGLQGARDKASLFGFRGAQYPWEAGRDGAEVTPSWAETGWAEQHTIGPAVAAWQYFLATGDKIFLQEKAWPIIQEIATWLESRGSFTKRGFEFKFMMGHDEWISNVSNSSYFNLLARRVLMYAVDCANELHLQYPAAWKRMADHIFIPMNAAHNVIYPFDLTAKVRVFDPVKNEYFDEMPSFGSKSYTLGNLNALFVHDVPVSSALIHSTYAAEEKMRLERAASPNVPGSIKSPSFVFPPLMTLAAFCGDNIRAHRVFDSSWKQFWLPPFGMIREYQSQGYGSYITAFGSLLQNTLLGFTGLRIKKGNWALYKASLPSGWTSIEVDQLWIHGRSHRLFAVDNRKPVLSLNSP